MAGFQPSLLMTTSSSFIWDSDFVLRISDFPPQADWRPGAPLIWGCTCGFVELSPMFSFRISDL